VSLCGDRFEQPFDAAFAQKVANEGVNDEKLVDLTNPSYENFYRFVIDYADGIVVATDSADPALVEYARQSGKPMMEFESVEEAVMFDNYNRFYEEIQ
jgi:starch synthase